MSVDTHIQDAMRDAGTLQVLVKELSIAIHREHVRDPLTLDCVCFSKTTNIFTSFI